MIITCPACSSQYLLPDDAIGEKGRRVKCTTCDYTWLQSADEVPEIAYLDPGEGTLESTDPQYYQDQDEDEHAINIHDFIDDTYRLMRLNRARIAIDGFMYALCALIITGVLLVSFSDKIVSKWPESALLFEIMKIPVAPPGQGIEFRDLKIATTATRTENGDIAVTGILVNSAQSFIRLPQLRVRAFAENGVWLKDWTINLGSAVLTAGKEATLDYLLQNAPAGTAKINLIFID